MNDGDWRTSTTTDADGVLVTRRLHDQPGVCVSLFTYNGAACGYNVSASVREDEAPAGAPEAAAACRSLATHLMKAAQRVAPASDKASTAEWALATVQHVQAVLDEAGLYLAMYMTGTVTVGHASWDAEEPSDDDDE